MGGGGGLKPVLQAPNIYSACVRGSPVVPLVGNIFTICTNLIGANGKNGNVIGINGTFLPTKGTVERTPNTRIVDLCSYMWWYVLLYFFHPTGLSLHCYSKCITSRVKEIQ